MSAEFDFVVLSTGFGVESAPDGFQMISYWRNESLAQPELKPKRRTYVISGYGDGALVDLCRLTIAQFRQDKIIDDLLGKHRTRAETIIRKVIQSRPSQSRFDVLSAIPSSVTSLALSSIKERVRKDTDVVLHVAGRSATVSRFEHVFDHKASFLNKFLLFVLHKAKAFTLNFQDLEDAARSLNVGKESIICRHGTRARDEVQRILPRTAAIRARLDVMESSACQSADLLWPAGFFPYLRE
jgi:hypothetical protein